MNIKNDPALLEWLFIAKGIGIILVVIGHFLPALSPTYWVQINTIIYTFHMPLFFILSGYLYKNGKYPYLAVIKNKAQRLLYPFVSIGLLFFLIKYGVGQFATLEHPVDMASLYALLINPAHSYMPLLWFVHALFLIFALYPLARLFLNNTVILLILIISNSFNPHFFIVQNAIANMPFFIIGVMFQENKKCSEMVINGKWLPIFIAFCLFTVAYLIQSTMTLIPLYNYLKNFILGIIGSLVIMNMSLAISTFPSKKITGFLQEVGYYSMTIYLFHTLFESAIRIGFSYFDFIQIPFELIAFIAIVCGVFFPWRLEKDILRHYGVTRKFILGLSH